MQVINIVDGSAAVLAEYSSGLFDCADEIERSIDKAFLAARHPADPPTTVLPLVVEAVAKREPTRPGAGAVSATQGLDTLYDSWFVDEDFVVSDEEAGASVEPTESYVAALCRLLDASFQDVERKGLDRDLAPLVSFLDGREVEAFRWGADDVAGCIRTMVALRFKILLFDASRRREVGREAALRVSMAYLDEVGAIQARAQEITNELIRAANVDQMRSVANTRSRLLSTAVEIRSFVAQVQQEIARGDGASGAPERTDPFAPATGAALVQTNAAGGIDEPFPCPGEQPADGALWWSKTNGRTARAKRRAAATERAPSATAMRRVVVFASSLLVLVSMALYFFLEQKIESRYRDRAPDFAKFDPSKFSGILSVQSAMRMHDAADIVVQNDWPRLSPDHKREKVGALFSVLRPSGVAQLFVFDEARRMVASCKNGVVTVIQ